MINNLVLQDDGKILISGELSKIDNITTSGITRLDSLGGHDPEFISPVMGNNDMVTAIVRYADQRIAIGGCYITDTSATNHYIAGLDPDGMVDDWCEVDYPDAPVLALHVQSDDKLVVGGEFKQIRGSAINALARLDALGNLDSSFVTNLSEDARVHCIAKHPDGNIWVGGGFSEAGEPDQHKNFALISGDGSFHSGFKDSVDDWVFSAHAQQDGQVVIGGVFKQVAGQEQKYLARIRADGTLDTSFSPDMGMLGWVYAIAQQEDGKLVLGGEFTSVNGVDRNHIARLNQDGSLDTGFDPGNGADESVKVLSVLPDGKILIAGEFKNYDDSARRHMARINPDGSLDHSFGD